MYVCAYVAMHLNVSDDSVLFAAFVLLLQVPPGFVFHHANSYYDEDTNSMVIICVRLNKFPDFDKQAGQAGRPFVVRTYAPSGADNSMQPHPLPCAAASHTHGL